jgi:hypothetical protein
MAGEKFPDPESYGLKVLAAWAECTMSSQADAGGTTTSPEICHPAAQPNGLSCCNPLPRLAPVGFPRFAQLSRPTAPCTYASPNVANLCIKHGTTAMFRHRCVDRPRRRTRLSGRNPVGSTILRAGFPVPRPRLHRSTGQRLRRSRLQSPRRSSG